MVRSVCLAGTVCLMLGLLSCAGGSSSRPGAAMDASGFSLQLDSQGSEYPVTTKITLDGEGRYAREVRRNPYAGAPTASEMVGGTVPREKLQEFIHEAVTVRKFFSMPERYEHTGPQKMDMATSHLRITWQGRTHRIGGYDVWGVAEYKGLFQLVRDLEKTFVIVTSPGLAR